MISFPDNETCYNQSVFLFSLPTIQPTMSEIKIASEFASNLRLRNTARLLFQKIRREAGNGGEIILNFSDVSFMSRAFADQFVKELITLESEGKVKVALGNIPFPIQQLLKTVQITQSERKVLQSNIRTMHFDSVEAMRDFMFAW